MNTITASPWIWTLLPLAAPALGAGLLGTAILFASVAGAARRFYAPPARRRAVAGSASPAK